jgi:3-oxoacyl-[acyl-carrier-protein] synthase II
VEVVVTGIGLVSALGGLEPSWRSLLEGESGIKQHQPFPEIPSRPLALVGEATTSLDTLTQRVVADAVQDAGLTLPIPECGVAIGSSRGCQASWEQMAKRLGAGGQRGQPTPLFSHSPLPTPYLPAIDLEQWLDTLPHQAAIATAHQIGAKGPVLAPMAACATGIWAIAQGFELIQTGQCQQVIAGAVEAPITPLTLAGFAKWGLWLIGVPILLTDIGKGWF